MAKTRMQRLKSGRPSPDHLEINRWTREQEARLGIGEVPSVGGNLPTVTVYPGPVVIERLAHYGADLLIANNPAYAATCARLDAELAEIIEGSKFNLAPLPRSKHSRKSETGPSVMTND